MKGIKGKKRLSLNTKNTLIGLSFILPNFIGFCVFIMVPVIFSFGLSFMEWDGFTPMTYVGLKNFTDLFSDSTFKISFINTVYFALFTVPTTVVISLGLAVLLNKKIKGLNFYRSALFFPYVASIVAVAVVWNMLFQKDFGPINSFLRFVGMENPPKWVASSDWAMPAVIIVSIWKGMGYYMVIYLAALQGIPKSLYEAAKIDGASNWQKFRYVTRPMLTPATFFVVMMLTISCFKVFDLVYIMTEGGPGRSTTMLVNYIYDKAFLSWDYGSASAISIVLFIVVATISIIQFRVEKKWVSYM
ncbi:carbohydrate ABC transporter permease [Vallitalea sp.]|jgi:ABC-type sugar transport system permease subunit|uniref:carbohydrate ABC transporter permease n=1 Tax=Vallitalea sp. TaxID=1882829 RepID=UPI0025DECB70|nr:sugar ABC transporter permease [Vallitalea sp.]MCT4685956.1 sugar ABC transporter permease [Vallitalea sp.]